MRTANLHSYRLMPLLLLLLLATLLGTMLTTGTARAASEPTLKVLAYNHEFDADNCTVATVAAKGFSTPHISLSAIATLAAIGSAELTVSPAQVAVGVDGNFDVKAKLCYPRTEFTRLVQITDLHITATDPTTGVQAVSEPLNITDPQPTLRALHTTVPQLTSCATVVLLGNNVLASRLVPNYVYISGTTQDTGSVLIAQPSIVNALSGGNISISAQFCGLAPRQSFIVQVYDLGSFYSSNQVTINTI
ncbi:hypothetical protein [Dictyobacter formicarum]|uniref:Uncharacterized protein n=1 Tax=Dictyobacter formicarum TaxID=2778368 RepID=A0ABQ3VSI8_9CHLR|nr:hypothetical protein [Dictyobacter formicarum]GHO89247.1 hypothetical protein KSZ_72530 [Dictyobacter formicarum]